MKFKIENEETGFKPVSFTITCDSKYELDFWGALFNYVPVSSLLRQYTKYTRPETMYEALERQGADINWLVQDIKMHFLEHFKDRK
jgi:hypothetical protein